jgi:DnaK suppressor protein
MAGKSATAVKKIRELSEEDVLAAPDKDYMNEAQLAFFRRKLIELRDQLLQNADDTGEHLRENEVTTDPSDRATLEEEYTLELRTRDRERKLLKKVEKSIRLIDDGSYGFCEETGEPIGVARLIARPTATLSLEAQERRERVQKMYGDD